MAKDFVKLGELFPDKAIRCQVRGCRNLWTVSGDEAVLHLASDDPEVPEHMCDTCLKRYRQSKDLEIICANPDCEKTSTWTRYQQVEAAVRGYRTPPRRFCGECRARMNEMQDRQMPCRMNGCKRTWTWTRAQQMTWTRATPPSRLCDDCYDSVQTLAEKEVLCRVKNCGRIWKWSPYQQLEHLLAGQDMARPPRRMCEACHAALRELTDIELPCRCSDCQKTWTFTAYAQLEQSLRQEAPPPERMCPECHQFWRSLRNQERPCRNRGCSNTWIYTRSWQLRDWLKGKDHPAHLMCKTCQKKLAQLQNRQMPCGIPGCEGTWNYTPEEQLKDQLAGRIEPRSRRCQACDQFLADHEQAQLQCAHCGKSITWSAYEQLLCDKGTFVKPETCAECAGRELSSHTGRMELPVQHHHLVRIPPGGKWTAFPHLASWPPHLDHDAVNHAETADLRIVALGDDLTFSSAAKEESWPFMLEQRLNQALQTQGITAAVVNCGMPGTNTRDALRRLSRDVVPFQPHLVVFSFVFSDAYVRPQTMAKPPVAELPAASFKVMEELWDKLRKSAGQLLYWTSNPIFPHDFAEQSNGSSAMRRWADQVEARTNQHLAHALHLCSSCGVPVLDVRSRFEINGSRSARKWMSDWYNHNEAGARNIAMWMADFILHEGLLPVNPHISRLQESPAG